MSQERMYWYNVRILVLKEPPKYFALRVPAQFIQDEYRTKVQAWGFAHATEKAHEIQTAMELVLGMCTTALIGVAQDEHAAEAYRKSKLALVSTAKDA